MGMLDTPPITIGGLKSIPAQLAAVQGAVGNQWISDISGNYWIGLGHSMMAGAGSSNAGSKAFTALINTTYTALNAYFYTNAGVPGERSDQILARLDAIISAIPAGRKANFCVICGANDADQLVPVATFGENLAQIIAKIKLAKCGMVLTIDPPRGSAVAQNKKDALLKIVAETRRQASLNNIPTIDLFGLMADTSGNLATAYNADDTHFNDAGHYLWAQQFMALTDAVARAPANIAAPGSGHAVANPLLAGTIGANLPTGWSRHAMSTLTPTVALAANDDGAGNKLTFTLDTTGGAGSYIIDCGLTASPWAAGDVLGVTFSAKVVDGTGTWAACVDAGGFLFGYVMNGASVYQGVGVGKRKLAKRNYGKVLSAPAGTGFRMWVYQPAGYVMTYTLSEVDVVNETSLGVSV